MQAFTIVIRTLQAGDPHILGVVTVGSGLANGQSRAGRHIALAPLAIQLAEHRATPGPKV